MIYFVKSAAIVTDPRINLICVHTVVLRAVRYNFGMAASAGDAVQQLVRVSHQCTVVVDPLDLRSLVS